MKGGVCPLVETVADICLKLEDFQDMLKKHKGEYVGELAEYDVTSMYPSIDRKDFYKVMQQLFNKIKKAHRRRKVIFGVDLKTGNSWFDDEQEMEDNTNKRRFYLTLDKLHEMICYLFQNSHMKISNRIITNEEGLPMGSASCVYCFNLYLCWYELKWLTEMCDKPVENYKQIICARCFCIYVDNIIVFNTKLFDELYKEIYHKNLEIEIEMMGSKIHTHEFELTLDISSSKPRLLNAMYSNASDPAYTNVIWTKYPHWYSCLSRDCITNILNFRFLVAAAICSQRIYVSRYIVRVIIDLLTREFPVKKLIEKTREVFRRHKDKWSLRSPLKLRYENTITTVFKFVEENLRKKVIPLLNITYALNT